MSEEVIGALQRRIDELEDEATRLEVQVVDLKGRLAEEDDALDRRRTELRLSYIGTIQAMSLAIEAKDPYTQGHSELVTKYSLALAREMGHSWSDLERIQIAAMLLDVGKIAVPQEILMKTTPLNEEEMRLMRTHVEHGARILEPVIYPWEVSSLVFQHHERFDGSGYPKGFEGDQIAPEARILGLVDSFCAMITDRAYRGAHTHEQVIGHIRENSGKLFDPDVVRAFDRLLKKDEEEIFRELTEFVGDGS